MDARDNRFIHPFPSCPRLPETSLTLALHGKVPVYVSGISGCWKGNKNYLSQKGNYTDLCSTWEDVHFFTVPICLSALRWISLQQQKKLAMQKPPFATCLVYHFYFKVSSNKPGECINPTLPFLLPPPGRSWWRQYNNCRGGRRAAGSHNAGRSYAMTPAGPWIMDLD